MAGFRIACGCEACLSIGTKARIIIGNLLGALSRRTCSSGRWRAAKSGRAFEWAGRGRRTRKTGDLPFHAVITSPEAFRPVYASGRIIPRDFIPMTTRSTMVSIESLAWLRTMS